MTDKPYDTLLPGSFEYSDAHNIVKAGIMQGDAVETTKFVEFDRIELFKRYKDSEVPWPKLVGQDMLREDTIITIITL